LHAKVRRALLAASLVLTATAVARAQPADPLGDVLANSASSPALPTAPQPYQSVRQPLSAADASAFRGAMESARRGDVSGARSYIATISDKIARKTATWALVDAAADTMGFNDVDMARRELEGWPREAKRRAAAERLLETSGKSPRETVEWFGGSEPQTAQGAMALAAAYRGVGKTEDATKLIRKWWRGKGFEADVQRTMMARFGDVLTPEDYGRRADVLLYGAQGPAARDLIALLPADQQQAALARIALRADARDADSQFAALTPALSASPGVAFERAAWLRRKGQEADAINLLSSFPKEVVTAEQGDRIWDERHRLTLFALRNGDAREAYLAAADSGLTSGADAADAEFYAGWIALSKLKEPARAAKHFAALEKIGSSPITRGRALYWLGRSAEAQGDQAGAQAWYAKAAEYPTVFYGQLAAEKLGRRLELGQDPTITDRHREKFEARETVQAARLLFDQGRPDLFRVFVLALDDTLPTLEDQALLVDMARGYGDQDISMKAVRAAAQRGFVLPVRGYPFRSPPSVGGGPEPALVLGITRQESGFDPLVPLRRRRARHDAAHARHRSDRRPQGRRQLFAKHARRPRLQHAPGLQLPRPARGPVLGLLRHGDRRLQRRPRPPHSVVGLLRRPAQLGRRRRLHRVHPLLRDPQLRHAGDGGHAGLSLQAERRLRPDHPVVRPHARQLRLSVVIWSDTDGDHHHGGHGLRDHVADLELTPARGDHRAFRRPHQFAGQAEGFAQHARRQGLFGDVQGDQPSGVQHRQPVAGPHRQGQVVQGHHHRPALGGFLAQQVQGHELGVGIEAGGGLIGQQQGRVRHQQPRQQRPRPLTARQVEHAALGHAGQAHPFKRPQRRRTR
jgi:soluble lytic murein transglycosylase